MGGAIEAQFSIAWVMPLAVNWMKCVVKCQTWGDWGSKSQLVMLPETTLLPEVLHLLKEVFTVNVHCLKQMEPGCQCIPRATQWAKWDCNNRGDCDSLYLKDL